MKILRFTHLVSKRHTDITKIPLCVRKYQIPYFGLKLSKGSTKWVFLKISERYDKSEKNLPQNRYFSKLV